jgi:hypothetical protein
MIEREEVLRQAAYDVVTKWLDTAEEEARFHERCRPGTDQLLAVASKELDRWRAHNFDLEEKHRIIFDLAPAELERMQRLVGLLGISSLPSRTTKTFA